MNSPFRRPAVLTLTFLLGAGLFQSCKKKDDDGAAPLVPPTLEFLGASNTAGTEFEPGDDLVVSCDGYLTLMLGPQGENDGTILNWTLMPPHICGSLEQCGYVAVDFLDDQGVVLVTFEQAVASPLLDLSSVAVDQVSQIRATLTLGDTGVPFENEGAPVSALWEGSISRECDGAGGAGGEGGGDAGSGGNDAGTGGGSASGGADGSGGEPSLMGGAGGLGGGFSQTR